jgi:uncharacterized protein (DUF111 family)
MSAIVNSIFDAIKSEVSTAVGAGWVELRRVLEPEKNDFRTMERGYGVRHGSAFNAAGVTRVYTLDHGFAVILTRRVVSRNDDEEMQEAINDLYDKADEVLKRVFLTKLGLPSLVLNVDTPEIDAPIVLESGGVYIEVRFNVKYRQAIA